MLKKILKSPIFISICILALLYIFLFNQIPWDLILRDTMVSGGDTGSHNYIAYKIKDIFPTIKTWTHDWYGGFPFLYFYPPLMFVFSALLSFVLKLNVAFKITTLLGTLLLPICVYLGLKFLNYKKHIPELGALGSIMFLFLEAFSIYGANIPSTLAGEFSYSFSFALFFLFIGLFSKGMDENKYLIPNIVILAIMALAHPFPVISATLYAMILIFVKKAWKSRLIYMIKTFGMAFFISAFWSIPFLYYKGYTSMMNWYRTIEIKEIFPDFLILFWLSAVVGLFVSIISKNWKIVNFLIIGITNFVLFLLINNSPIYNTRFLPFFIMTYILVGAIGLGYLLDEVFKDSKALNVIAVVILIVWNLSLINPIFFWGKNTRITSQVKFIPLWMNWNYSGFENKDAYINSAMPLFEYLKTLPYGKVMWEYRPEYDSYGTPRFLENIPILTGKPTYEGLLIESSVFGPFHFINQTETTQSPTSAIAGFEYPPFDFKKGVEHLKLSNARYFVAFTDTIKNLAKENMTWLANAGSFSVYEVPENNLVDVYDDYEVIKREKKWIKKSIDWYKNGDLNIPIAFYSSKKEREMLMKTENSPKVNDVLVKELTENRISFETKDINRLHLLKVSYFPTWKVKGGDGPFLVSPSFIGIIPRQNNVTVYFGMGIIDQISYALTYLSIALILVKILKPKLIKFL